MNPDSHTHTRQAMPERAGAREHSAGPAYAVVVVTYNPDLPRLRQLMACLAHRGRQRVLFDNASDNQPAVADLADASGFEFTASPANIGIAEAINRSVAGLAHELEYFVTFDQDSLPEPQYCEHLIDTLSAARSQGAPAAAAGGRVIDQPQGLPLHFVSIGVLGVRHLDPESGDVHPDYLIISGCAFHRPTFEASGGFDAQLFVDNVDVEWSYRIRRLGCCLIGTHRVSLDHRIGDDHLEAPFVNRWLKLHGPERLRLMTRSRVLSYRKASLTLAWKLQDLLRFILKTTAVLVFRGERIRTLQNVARGALDGLRMPLTDPARPSP